MKHINDIINEDFRLSQSTLPEGTMRLDYPDYDENMFTVLKFQNKKMSIMFFKNEAELESYFCDFYEELYNDDTASDVCAECFGLKKGEFYLAIDSKKKNNQIYHYILRHKNR